MSRAAGTYLGTFTVVQGVADIAKDKYWCPGLCGT